LTGCDSPTDGTVRTEKDFTEGFCPALCKSGVYFFPTVAEFDLFTLGNPEKGVFHMKGGNFFSAKRIAVAAVAVALAYVVSLLGFPVFPAVSFLKLDFSFAFMLLGSYLLGPVYGEIILLAVEGLCLIKSSWTGVLSNFVMGQFFVVLPSLIYIFRKGIKNVLMTLVCCSVLAVAVSLPMNRFISYPLYEAFLSMSAAEFFAQTFGFIILFNFIKCAANSLIALLLYKRLRLLLFKD